MSALTSEMVDAMVVAYGTTSPLPQEARLRAMCEASAALLERLPQVRISAIAWAEFTTTVRAIPADRLAGVTAKLQIEAFSAAAADVGADLLRRYRTRAKSCPVCYGALPPVPCRGCKALRSKQQHVNDAYIVATAEALDDVDVLYSFDGGVLDLGLHVRRCRVVRPPHPVGPVFDAAVPPSSKP